jgi:predicted nucleotidyltransferase
LVDGTNDALNHVFGLTPHEWALIQGTLARNPKITGAILFGSRAKGTAGPASDIDLALLGIDDPLQAEAEARNLEDLPLPYRFDVKALSAIRSKAVREHIDRVGIRIYTAEIPNVT